MSVQTMPAGDRPSVSLVIPAYNEEERLGELADALAAEAAAEMTRAGLEYLEAIVVDDGSEDATPRILERIAAADPRVRPASVGPVNAGKGRAVAVGIAEARGDYVLVADVDLSTPLACTAALAEAMRAAGAAMAIGSRDIAGAQVKAPVHRHLLGEAFNLAVKRLTGLRHADTQCGFKLIEAPLARELVGEQISTGYAFDVELLVRARDRGAKVVEVPVIYVHDHRSRVRIGSASISMARDLLRIRRTLGGRRR
jgi:dolichyl-phosphate beta-glucosyltransferase